MNLFYQDGQNFKKKKNASMIALENQNLLKSFSGPKFQKSANDLFFNKPFITAIMKNILLQLEYRK